MSEKSVCHCPGIFHYLAGIIPERWLERFVKTYCLCRNGMHQRSTLHTREYSLVDGLGILGIAHYCPSSWPPERFVGRGRGEIRHPDRCRVDPCCTKASNVGDIGHAVCTSIIGYFLEYLEIDCPRIGRCSTDNDPRFFLSCHFANNTVIEHLTFRVHAILNDPVKLSGKTDW